MTFTVWSLDSFYFSIKTIDSVTDNDTGKMRLKY